MSVVEEVPAELKKRLNGTFDEVKGPARNEICIVSVLCHKKFCMNLQDTLIFTKFKF